MARRRKAPLTKPAATVPISIIQLLATQADSIREQHRKAVAAFNMNYRILQGQLKAVKTLETFHQEILDFVGGRSDLPILLQDYYTDLSVDLESAAEHPLPFQRG